MARIETEWPIGRTITNVRPMTAAELEAEGWDEYRYGGTALVLDGGGLIYASRDDEGNGPGALFAVMDDGVQLQLLGEQ